MNTASQTNLVVHGRSDARLSIVLTSDDLSSQAPLTPNDDVLDSCCNTCSLKDEDTKKGNDNDEDSTTVCPSDDETYSSSSTSFEPCCVLSNYSEYDDSQAKVGSSSSSLPQLLPLGDKRNVSFDDRIEIREYAVTVGEHPCCTGGLPLTLDWQHAPEFCYKSLETSGAERTGRYKVPRKLSYTLRRERLFTVSAYSENRVRSEEVDIVMKFLQSSWSSTTMLPLPKFEEWADEDDSEEEDVKPSLEQVKRWNRVMKRSESFHE